MKTSAPMMLTAMTTTTTVTTTIVTTTTRLVDVADLIPHLRSFLSIPQFV